MNPSWKCLRCGGADRYAIEQVLIPDFDSVNGIHAFTLTAHYGETGETGLFGAKMARAAVRAAATVCAACGYSELSTQDLDRLERMAEESIGGVRRIRT